MNQIIICGHVGKDPKISSTTTGNDVANFSVATKEKYKNQQGELTERTDWHYVVVFGGLVEVVRKLVKKGSKVLIQGKLRRKKYADKHGIERQECEIEVSKYNSTIEVLSFTEKEEIDDDHQNPYTSKNGYQNAKDGDCEF